MPTRTTRRQFSSIIVPTVVFVAHLVTPIYTQGSPCGMGLTFFPEGVASRIGATRSNDVYRHELHSSVAFAAYMLRIPGVGSDDVCVAVTLRVITLSGFDILLLCTSHTHVHRGYRRKGERFWHGCRCVAAAVPLCTDFVAARVNGCF